MGSSQRRRSLKLETIIVIICCIGLLATGYSLLFLRREVKENVGVTSVGSINTSGSDIRVKDETEQSWFSVARDTKFFRKKQKPISKVALPARSIAEESPTIAAPVDTPVPESKPVMFSPIATNDVTPEPVPIKNLTPFQRKDSEFWIWGGVGENYQYYEQTIPSLSGSTKFQNIQGPTLYFSAGTQGNNFGVEFTHKQTPGQMQVPSGATILNGDFIWKTLSVEGLYKIDDSTIRLRSGVQYHLMPFMVYNPITLELDVKSNTLALATVGFDKIFPISKKLRGEWLMRYQHPIISGTSNSDSFDVSPLLAFDGSIGTVYSVGENLRLGLYWYGQYHHYRFKYSGASIFSGEQTLFYSNAEVRVGWEF